MSQKILNELKQNAADFIKTMILKSQDRVKGQATRTSHSQIEVIGGKREMKMVIPNNAVGVIIGIKGTTIQRIQRRTNTRVQIPNRNQRGLTKTECTISGMQHNIVQAVRMILDLIIESQNRVGNKDRGLFNIT